MKKKIFLDMSPQPDNTSCGPTCLHAVYQYYNDDISLNQVIAEVEQFASGGGTLSNILGSHALDRGYKVTLVSYNLNIFDPTWSHLPQKSLIAKLEKQLEVRIPDSKYSIASRAYINFIKKGGVVQFDELTTELLQSYLIKDYPILVGLSATYLYQSLRENPDTNEWDEFGGSPVGHFVVLSGFNKKSGEILVADPYIPNPVANQHYYKIKAERIIAAILLGVVTYDGNFLVIEPKK